MPQEAHKDVVDELLSKSHETRPKRLQMKYVRKQRQKSATIACRQWYVSPEAWIAGTTTSSEAVPEFFEPQANTKAEAEALQKILTVSMDEGQPDCAISGEKFDIDKDPETGDWVYIGAKRIYGKEAEQYGVADGSIVKVKCLSPADVTTMDTNASSDVEPISAEAPGPPSKSEQPEHKLEQNNPIVSVKDEKPPIKGLGVGREEAVTAKGVDDAPLEQMQTVVAVGNPTIMAADIPQRCAEDALLPPDASEPIAKRARIA